MKKLIRRWAEDDAEVCESSSDEGACFGAPLPLCEDALKVTRISPDVVRCRGSEIVQ